MTTNTNNYETGATTHAVNDLILFTDNTKVLAELRDSLYQDWATYGNFGTGLLRLRFMPLFESARKHYIQEFSKSGAGHIVNMTNNQISEYCQLYVNDFTNWKQDHGIK
jgi:hypothetical protein